MISVVAPLAGSFALIFGGCCSNVRISYRILAAKNLTNHRSTV